MPAPQLSNTIKSTVRQRIMMHSGDQDLVLFEGKLATEFGVSRTPIRQVMQSLASEWLVEVRSGVGTIAKPLLPERRLKDLKSFSAILRACSECTTDSQLNRVSIEIAMLKMLLEKSQQGPASDRYFDAATKFSVCLADLVEDEVMKDALIACYWRFVRRRIAEHESDFEAVIAELAKLAKDAEYGAEGGGAEAVLRMVGGTVDNLSAV